MKEQLIKIFRLKADAPEEGILQEAENLRVQLDTATSFMEMLQKEIGFEPDDEPEDIIEKIRSLKAGAKNADGREKRIAVLMSASHSRETAEEIIRTQDALGHQEPKILSEEEIAAAAEEAKAGKGKKKTAAKTN